MFSVSYCTKITRKEIGKRCRSFLERRSFQKCKKNEKRIMLFIPIIYSKMEEAKNSILCFQCLYNIIYSKFPFCNTQHCRIDKGTVIDIAPAFFAHGLYDIGHYFSACATILGLAFNTTNQTFHNITSTIDLTFGVGLYSFIPIFISNICANHI